MNKNSCLMTGSCLLLCWLIDPVAADWPMWRADAGRTGVAREAAPETPALRWLRKLPALTPAFRSPRLQFDAGYEPIVSGGLVIAGSSRNDSVTAFDAQSGEQRWQFFTEGPVRFAPVAWRDRVFFGSDDGCVYCLEIQSGKELWKRRAVPSQRKILGNRRLISVWPVRGGPVVADERLYFAAGVWPMEGIVVYCLDALSGETIWLNDRLGYRYDQHPHNTQAIGGLAPQGYLVVDGKELVVPCSTAYPARLNRRNGKLIEFKLPTPGRLPGGWFAALDPDTHQALRRGKLSFDDVVNRQQHEDREHTGHGTSGISRVIHSGTRKIRFDEPLQGVEGTIHSMAIAEGRLFVTTREGYLYCFDDKSRVTEPATVYERPSGDVPNVKNVSPEREGWHALVTNLVDADQVRTLVHSGARVVAFAPEQSSVDRFRAELDRAGLYGSRVAVWQGKFQDFDLPPYFAEQMIAGDADETERMLNGVSADLSKLLNSLRPHTGQASFQVPQQLRDKVTQKLESILGPGFGVEVRQSEVVVIRGELPGSRDYLGGWQENRDQRVRFPLGVLWFDDTLGHFKRSPQPQFIRGVMASRSKNWSVPMIRGLKGQDYPLRGVVMSDVYSGRVLQSTEAEARETAKQLQPPPVRASGREPSQYRPASQKNAWSPGQPAPGMRLNPLTGNREPRTFPKTYGCDGGVDYGSFYTMRSGTAAFYDKTLESGTVFVSGPRSGCTNSIIPACGVLNVPYYYEGCTCSYPLPSALTLVSMPEYHEQWATWGKSRPEQIQRIGINFGAPGDRKTRDGTLWLEYPSAGGPSPELDVSVAPQNTTAHYRHSLFAAGGRGWPWVYSSSVAGLESFTLRKLKPGRYTVRLFFAETLQAKAGERLQDVFVGKKRVAGALDIVTGAGGPLRGLVLELDEVELDDTFTLRLSSIRGRTLLSGIELIASGLDRARVPVVKLR